MKGECKDREQTCENRRRGNEKRTWTKWGTDRQTHRHTDRQRHREREKRQEQSRRDERAVQREGTDL